MDLHICNKKEVVDIEKNSIACSCVSQTIDVPDRGQLL